MDSDLLARQMVEAAEGGETEWSTHEAFVRRFGSLAQKSLTLLPSQLHALGWKIEPYSIKDYEIIPNAFGDGHPGPSGQPKGVRLSRL